MTMIRVPRDPEPITVLPPLARIAAQRGYEAAVKADSIVVEKIAADKKVTGYVLGSDSKFYWKDAGGYGVSNKMTQAEYQELVAAQTVAPDHVGLDLIDIGGDRVTIDGG